MRAARAAGFLKGDLDVPDERLAAKLAFRFLGRRSRGDLGMGDEIDLVSFDEKRVYWFVNDPRRAVTEGTGTYVREVERLAVISRGALPVTGVSERWEMGLGERIRIEIELPDRRESIFVMKGRAFDLHVVKGLDRLVRNHGLSYRFLDPLPEDCFAAVVGRTLRQWDTLALALNRDEEKRLTRERGWKLARP